MPMDFLVHGCGDMAGCLSWETTSIMDQGCARLGRPRHLAYTYNYPERCD